MACFTEGSDDGTINGVADTTIVSAPAADVRRIVRSMQISTTVNASLSVELKNGSDYRVIWAGSLKQGDTWFWGDGDILVLDSTTKSVVARLAGTIASPMDFITSWGDQT